MSAEPIDPWNIIGIDEVRQILGGVSRQRVRHLTVSGALWSAKISPHVRIYWRPQVLELQRRREDAKRTAARRKVPA